MIDKPLGSLALEPTETIMQSRMRQLQAHYLHRCPVGHPLIPLQSQDLTQLLRLSLGGLQGLFLLPLPLLLSTFA